MKFGIVVEVTVRGISINDGYDVSLYTKRCFDEYEVCKADFNLSRAYGLVVESACADAIDFGIEVSSVEVCHKPCVRH